MKLKSADLEKKFQEVGAVRILNFLTSSDLLRIKELYDELGLSDLKGIYSNVKDKSSEYNTRVDVIFQEIYKQSIEKHFEGYQVGGGAFLIKGTGNESHSSLHQDWNVVDENKYQSASIFCPIQDVGEGNGCLKVLKGSHKWFQNIRSFHCPSPFLNFDQVDRGLVSFPALAGDAIVFRHNIFHGSKPNLTSNNRIVATVSIASKKAEYIHYMKQGNNFKVVKADNLFFNEKVSKLIDGEKVSLEEIGEVSLEESHILTLSELEGKYRQEYPTSIYQRAKGLFNYK
jgi:ectoine hydroxylase-related dioxygenase (phytanoyl-CoA dioxygenase family)